MSASEAALPPGFESLEPFAEDWAIPVCDDRARRRRESSEDERRAFYEVAQPLSQAALAHLDRKPLGEFDAAEERLMNLMLSYAHVSLAVEVQRDHEARLAGMSRYMRITRASADQDG